MLVSKVFNLVDVVGDVITFVHLHDDFVPYEQNYSQTFGLMDVA